MKIKLEAENKPHKHAELIKAWADGAEIETRWLNSKLKDSQLWHKFNGEWGVECEDGSREYRIKPEPKPDVVTYHINNYFEIGEFSIMSSSLEWIDEKGKPVRPQLKVTWDGETSNLKDAEVL